MGARIEADLAGEATPAQLAEMRECLREVPVPEALAGLRFARRRWESKGAGTLRVGRRGIVRMEVTAVTPEQARWRLENWRLMVANYRRRGYSYPTISRIKRGLAGVAGGD